ncbi:MAG: putative metal-dependent hydrolase YcfH [Candidatus Westeberhardia cardiocondylae]|nr:putative metal-dependent hydrolase YcfH [Candidatus Westeberhardia cardiocondylae]
MFLVDSHCHLSKLNYETLHINIQDVIKKAKKCNVKMILSVCNTLSDFNTTIKMTGYYNNNVILSCGIHPLYVNKLCNFQKLRSISKLSCVKALGETGLDFFRKKNNKKQQKIFFRKHIQIGKEINKPVIIHTRNAEKETLNILQEEKIEKCGGVIHCFTGNRKIAKKFLDLGLYLSISGIITFKNSEILQKTIQYIPLSYLLLETDSPYLAPIPYRGTENQPAYINNIAYVISKIKKISLEHLSSITTFNFFQLFKIYPLNNID